MDRVGVNSIISTLLQLQLRKFQLQLQFQPWLRPISRISTPTPTPEVSTPIPTPTPEFQIQAQLHFKSNPSCSTKLPLPNCNVKHCMNWMEVWCRYMPCRRENRCHIATSTWVNIGSDNGLLPSLYLNQHWLFVKGVVNHNPNQRRFMADSIHSSIFNLISCRKWKGLIINKAFRERRHPSAPRSVNG